ncbi:quinone oxidoreductase family protein [Acuticoccus sediminis]|uniref:quinone oxidoreductase family protein n=1 Tax=Acuticoccus sediminis TaxID=2184697 RepID=UPI001CFCABFC|nr:quinone oxidoreductase [Acuticoccus sediminis]
MTRAVRFHETGGPEVLRLDEVDVPAPGPGEVRIRQSASGVNFTDIYSRSGLYPAPLPSIPGREGVGVVTALGPGVTGWSVGERVSYASVTGSYAEERNLPAASLIRLPDGVDDVTAAAVTLRGLTAAVLVTDVHPVGPDSVVLVHAAAGGVGLILSQWASALGATVIGTVSTEAKAGIARPHCAGVLVAPGAELPARFRAATGGRRASVVYDAVGRDTFALSLDCLAPLGHMVVYGQSSGHIAPIAPQELGERGSLTLTRPRLPDYMADADRRAARAAALFGRIADGTIAVRAEHRYPLERAADAHRDLEGRRTTGSVVLTMDQR